MLLNPVTGAVIVLSIISAILYPKFNIEPQQSTKPVNNYKEYSRQIKCLADNIYYEAGNQPIAGKKAVAYVTLNRLHSDKWPNDVCSIVYQKTVDKATNKIVCQFSWVCEKRKQPEKDQWNLSYNVARHVWKEYNVNNKDPTFGSKFFHATYVRPQWNYQKVVQIGDHIFYR